MKFNFSRLLTLSIVAFTFSQVALAERTDTKSVIINANVITKITLTPPATVNLGDLAQGEGAAAPQALAFTVAGEPNHAFNIALAAGSADRLRKGAGGSTITEILLSPVLSASSGTLSSLGAGSFNVTITRAAILATQSTGAYTGTISATVRYP